MKSLILIQLLQASIAFHVAVPSLLRNVSSKGTSSFSISHKTILRAWDLSPSIVMGSPYITPVLRSDAKLQNQLVEKLKRYHEKGECLDPLWEQIRIEAQVQLESEPSSGPQLYTNIISQPSLMSAITSIVSHEISTQLIPSTLLQNLFVEMLHPIEDARAISFDVMASALRSPTLSDGKALISVLFNQGLHALVCHRLAHRLWISQRTGLAYYIQSTVSRKYSVDIHPGAKLGLGIYLNAGSAGVVIGETAVVEDDVIILQGVTLGGTGKERGDRHPKVRRRAILEQSCSVLGNITVGEGAIICAKSIVTKSVPSFTKASGVPAVLSGEVNWFTSDEAMGDLQNDDVSSDFKDALTKMSQTFWANIESELANASMSS